MRTFARAAIGVVGASNVVAGAALLAQPVWFFDNVGHFAPFNQHYEGDAGAFVLAIGLGLIIAAARPAAGGGLLAVGIAASFLHLANHVYASISSGASWSSTALVALQLVLLTAGAAISYVPAAHWRRPTRVNDPR